MRFLCKSTIMTARKIRERDPTIPGDKGEYERRTHYADDEYEPELWSSDRVELLRLIASEALAPVDCTPEEEEAIRMEAVPYTPPDKVPYSPKSEIDVKRQAFLTAQNRRGSL